jgi:Double zinc ribbon
MPLVEGVAAVLLGLAALWLVLQPLLTASPIAPPPPEPIDPEETPKGTALVALKEIEFDRETGKLSDSDYQMLKAKYTAAAVEALRAEAADKVDLEAMVAARVRLLSPATTTTTTPAPTCPACGPRPEPDAVFCSECGRRLFAAGSCTRCGATIVPGSRFCDSCGCQVAA